MLASSHTALNSVNGKIGERAMASVFTRFNLLFLVTLFLAVNCGRSAATQPAAAPQGKAGKKVIAEADEVEVDAEDDASDALKQETQPKVETKPTAKPEPDLQTKLMTMLTGTWQTSCLPSANIFFTETFTISAAGALEARRSDFTDAACTRSVAANRVNYVFYVVDAITAIKENGAPNNFIAEFSYDKTTRNGVLTDIQGIFMNLVKVEGGNLTREEPASAKTTTFSANAIVYTKK